MRAGYELGLVTQRQKQMQGRRRSQGRRRKLTAGALGLGLICLLFPAIALASGSGEHWSYLNVLPESLLNILRNMWGTTWIDGEESSGKVMHVLWGILAVVFAMLLTGAAAKKLQQPGDEAVLPEKKFGIFTVFELVAEWFLNVMTETMGRKHALFFFPLIMAFAIFIFIGNFMGLIPGFLTPNDNFNTTLALATVTFGVTHYYGVKEHGAASYFAHFLGPIRAWYALPLMILMLFIEIISHIARPISLAIRLMGNMFGDHKVLGAFLGFGLILVPLPVMVLGLIVVTVQTLVFCLLSVVYIALAVEHSEDH